ncbi:MAG: hypothetical protein KTV16_16535 [Acidimicrobiia bacterium]|nr:hypothetical protein [Acidimicrobiia bacterium]
MADAAGHADGPLLRPTRHGDQTAPRHLHVRTFAHIVDRRAAQIGMPVLCV